MYISYISYCQLWNNFACPATRGKKRRQNKWEWKWDWIWLIFLMVLWVSRDSKHIQIRRIKWKPHSELITAALINSKLRETVFPKIKYTLWNGCSLMIHQFALKLLHPTTTEGGKLSRVGVLYTVMIFFSWVGVVCDMREQRSCMQSLFEIVYSVYVFLNIKVKVSCSGHISVCVHVAWKCPLQGRKWKIKWNLSSLLYSQ